MSESCSECSCPGLAVIDQRLTTMQEAIADLRKFLVVGNGQPSFVAATDERLKGIETWKAVSEGAATERDRANRRYFLVWGLFIGIGSFLATSALVYATVLPFLHR